jgi:hypothetical protein
MPQDRALGGLTVADDGEDVGVGDPFINAALTGIGQTASGLRRPNTTG